MNLLIQVREDITDSVSEELANILRVSIDDMNKAIDIFLPGILGGITQIGKNNSGADSILGIINKQRINYHNTHSFVSAIKEQDKTSKLLDKGNYISNLFFGKKYSELLDLLVRKSGINEHAGRKLLSILTLLSFNKIAEIIKVKNFNINTLSKVLSHEDKVLLEITPCLKSLFKKTNSEPKIHSIEEYYKKNEKKDKASIWKRMFKA